jgi:polysaccharide biosynthesis protein PslF
MITAFPPTKVPEADHAFHLCEHLADRGFDVHVLTTKGSISASHSRITVHRIMRDWSWSDLSRLARFLRRCLPDAILLMYISWVYNYHPMITFAPTISKTFLPRVPFVTLFENAYGADPRSISLLARAVRKGIARWLGADKIDYSFGTLLHDSDRFIVVSNEIWAVLAERYPNMKNKSMLIPPPPLLRICSDDDGMIRKHKREALGVKSDDFLLVYFGYIYPTKGLETLLKAFLMVSNQRSNVRLVILGGSMAFPERPSYGQEIREMAKQMGIDDKMIWTGGYEWDSNEPSVYLRAADVCVLPFDRGVSVHNTSFAAAAVHGLPIITTQGATLEESFIHQENVFLCPPQNPEAIAAAIQTLMDKPELRQHLRVGTLQLAQEWFSWDRAIERTIATFL